MRLENRFTVPAALEDTWRLFEDVAAIAPLMPGAELESVSGDSFAGRVGVKVGAVRMSYRGRGTVTRDASRHEIVLDLSGSELRGAGTAAARVTARLAPDGTGTEVVVRTDLALTGRPAQFGRGILSEVADRLVTRFADNLAAYLAGPAPEGTGAGDAGPAASPAAPGPSAAPGTTAPGAAGPGAAGPGAAGPQPLDLGRAVLPVLARRAAAPAAVLASAALAAWLFTRARHRRGGAGR